MNNDLLKRLIKILSRLPSLGQRSAKRMALHLLNNKDNLLKPLIEVLGESYEEIQKCTDCGNFSAKDKCGICLDASRNKGIVCIVETVADLWAIEDSSIFKGYYHILNGYLSAIEGRGPESLNIQSLLDKLSSNPEIKEIIIATNPTIEGQTTAYYLAELLKSFDNIKITRPAYGIPMGSEFNYLDNSTLGIAFRGRKGF